MNKKSLFGFKGVQVLFTKSLGTDSKSKCNITTIIWKTNILFLPKKSYLYNE
mgnify:CR=1 FL=1